MSNHITSHAHIEKVLVEAVSLLVRRARVAAEGNSSTDPTREAELRQLREVERELGLIHEHLVHANLVPTAQGRQLSKYYEVPGQEDA